MLDAAQAHPKPPEFSVPQPVLTTDANPGEKSGSGFRWLIALFLMSAMGVGLYFLAPKIPFLHARANGKDAKPARRPVPVTTVRAKQEDMRIYLNSLGTVTAFNSVTLRSRVNGEIVKVLFNEGQTVKQGDLLVQIDPRLFQVQLLQAEGQLAKDNATLDNARIELERDKRLMQSNSISSQEVQSQEATVRQLEGSIKSDQALVDNAKLQLSYCQIAAPIGGKIGLRHVDQGNYVQANEQSGLAVITQSQPISVVFTVTQDEVFRLQQKIAGESSVVVEAFNRDFKTKLADGAFSALDNQVDPTTGTVKLKATFGNETNNLFPNQFVNVRLLMEIKKSATVIPAAAVQLGPDSTFVYVVKEDDTVELRPIVVGPTEADMTAIERGISPGEQVVMEGVDKLQAGTKVERRNANASSKDKDSARNKESATGAPKAKSGKAKKSP